MLLHARQGHVELLGKLRDRSVRTSELLQNAASGGVRERGERGVETGCRILNHLVQYIAHGLAACKGRPQSASRSLYGMRLSLMNIGPGRNLGALLHLADGAVG